MKDYSLLADYIDNVNKGFDSIPADRKNVINNIAEHVSSLDTNGEDVNLIFICNHNSRRSMFSQIWGKLASIHFDKTNIKSYSGGTEITRFNENAIEALKRTGLDIPEKKGLNPKYKVYFSETEKPITCFSKHFLDPANPKNRIIALMVCSEADQHCPFIPEALARFNLSFEDPKYSDGLKVQDEVYDKTCLEIATQIFYLFSKL